MTLLKEQIVVIDERIRSSQSKSDLHKDKIADLAKLQREVRDHEEEASRLAAKRINALSFLSGQKEQLSALETIRVNTELGGRHSVDMDWHRELNRQQQAADEQRVRYQKAVAMVREVY